MRKLFLSLALLLSLISISHGQSPCFSSSSIISTGAPHNSLFVTNTSALPDDRVLFSHVINTGSTPANILVQLGVPNFTTNTVSWGSAVTTVSNLQVLQSASGIEAIVLALSNTQAVILYKEDIPFQNNGKIKVINYPSSGNTISSVGPEVEFTDPDPTNNGGRYFSIARISNTKFLITYTDFLFTGIPLTAQIGTVSGNSITFSAKVRATDPCCDAFDHEFSDLKKLDTNKYLVTYTRTAETWTRYARIIDTSGADPVFGTSNQLTGPRSKNAKLAVLDTNDFILTWLQDNVAPTTDLVASVVCNVDVDVETITCNNTQIIYIGNTIPTSAIAIDSDTALIGLLNVNGVGNNVFAQISNVNNTIVVNSLALADSNYANIDNELFSNTRYIITGYDNTTPTYFANQFNIPCTPYSPLPESQGACPCAYGFTCNTNYCYVKKVRYISVSPNPMNAGLMTARRVTHVASGRKFWMSDPGTGIYSQLINAPVYLDWSLEAPVIHAYGCGVVPSSQYSVQEIRQGDSTSNESLFSSVLTLSTAKWGDPVSVIYSTPSTMWGEPNGVVNATDIQAAQLTLIDPSALNALPLSRCDMDANQFLNVTDLQRIIQAQGGQTYPFTPVASCP